MVNYNQLNPQPEEMMLTEFPQPQQQSYGGYPTSIMPTDRADLLDKIKPDLIVEIMQHKLMGEEFINGAWRINPALKEYSLTFLGAVNISNLLLAVTSQNTSLGNLKEHVINARALNIAKTAQRMCLHNWKEYGITSKDKLYFVNEIVFSLTLITLKQSENEGIRDLIRGTSKWSLNPQQPDKGGLLGLFRK